MKKVPKKNNKELGRGGGKRGSWFISQPTTLKAYGKKEFT